MYRRGPPTLLWIRQQCKVEGECWIWQRSRNSKGYGKLKYQGRNMYVHRIVYELVYREVADQVMHSCDVRLCCNPRHLSTGTNMDNVLDCIAKNRHVHGEHAVASKLTSGQVLAIRGDSRLHREIAADYGVSKSIIHNILSEKTWRHL